MTDLPTNGADGPRPRIRFGQPSRSAGRDLSFGAGGALAGVVLVVVLLGGLLWSAASGRPAAAEHPRLFGGSLVLEDSRPLTVLDVATAQIAVRLQGVDAQVGAASYGDVQPVAVSGGTVLVNSRTGAFNFLEQDDYVTDPKGPGVGLGNLSGLTGAEGVSAGTDAYILRSAASSTVSLVGQQTVSEAARNTAGAAVAPLGFASLDGRVDLRPGSEAVSGTDLWVLVDAGSGCRLDRLTPSDTASNGLALATIRLSQSCAAVTLEPAPGGVAAAEPGRVRFFSPSIPGPGRVVPLLATAGATRLIPVTGSGSTQWFLARRNSGWDLFGADRSGRAVGPYPLSAFGPASNPVVPVLSHGFLYTLDQSVSPQPTLWTVDPANGHMAPVAGAPLYPLRSPQEKDSFAGAQVLGDGPRVVFNNAQSLEAVVVFTDGSHAPVVVDKSAAVAVSTTGPADLNVTTPTTRPGKGGKSKTPTTGPAPPPRPVPVVQPVSQQVTCANTTQKPYVPQITSATPSSGAAVIAWSYQLLDQTDCEPSSWAVQVTALTGGHQPASPRRMVYGQNQILFSGLRPATTYQVVVTAYINAQSTPSTPTTFTTPARGPDAPLSVSTTSDGQGNWVVSWKPCSEATNPNCMVPADQWTVIGAACGGSYIGSPPSVTVAGGSDSVTINSDSLGLLGESLSFSVEGSLASGLAGNPTADHSCTEAWKTPDASAIALSGAGTATANSITATLQVSASGNPVEDFGGLPSQTEFVYSVDGTTVGPTTAPRVTVPGLPPGQQFTPSVQIYPAGHPGAAVTVTGAPFSQNLPWPADLQGGMAVVPTVDADPNQGTATVTFPADLPAGPLSATNVLLTCGSTGIPEPDGTVTGGRLSYPVDLVNSGGACQLSLTLDDTASPDPYGGPSPQLTAAFSIGGEPTYSFDSSVTSSCKLNFVCGLGGQPYQVQVDSTSGRPLDAGGDWSVSSSGTGPAALCSTNQGMPGPDFPYTFDLPAACPDASAVQITVSFRYLGQVISVGAGSPGGAGSPPTSTSSTTGPTTTTTTVPSTTLPPCTQASTTTTTQASTTTTTTKSGSASTVHGAAVSSTTSSSSTTAPPCLSSATVGGASPADTALAAASVAPAARVDPVVRSLIGWAAAALALGWAAGGLRRRSRRRRAGPLTHTDKDNP